MIKLTEMHKKNLLLEQEIREDRRKAGLSLDGYWILAGSLLGYCVTENDVTAAINSNQEIEL